MEEDTAKKTTGRGKWVSGTTTGGPIGSSIGKPLNPKIRVRRRAVKGDEIVLKGYGKEELPPYKSPAKKGRPKIKLGDIMEVVSYRWLLEDVGRSLWVKGGKSAAQFFLAAREVGIIVDKMPYSLAKTILPKIGAESGYNKYIKKWMDAEANHEGTSTMDYKDRKYNLFLERLRKEKAELDREEEEFYLE